MALQSNVLSGNSFSINADDNKKDQIKQQCQQNINKLLLSSERRIFGAMKTPGHDIQTPPHEQSAYPNKSSSSSLAKEVVQSSAILPSTHFPDVNAICASGGIFKKSVTVPNYGHQVSVKEYNRTTNSQR